MKVFKKLMAVLAVVVLAATLFGCSKSSDTSAATQEYTVKRGDISVVITAAGNLALSKTQDAVVDLFYPTGIKATIGSVLVQAGDTVKQGQVLATIDTDEWNDQLNNLQQTLITAQRNVSTKATALTDAQRQLASLQRAVITAEDNVTKAERNVTAKQFAVTQAQLNVTSANNSLYDINEVSDLQEKIDNANYAIKFATSVLGGELGGGIQVDYGYWQQLKSTYQGVLAEYQAEMHDLLGGTSTTTSADVALQVAQKVLAVQQAQMSLQDAQIAVNDAQEAVATAQQAVDDANYTVTKQQQAIVYAQQDLDQANSNLADAQKKVDDAEAKSPEIKAPFDGFITNVNVAGGDEVLNGTLVATVADPDLFEANISVSEMDIMKISVGGQADITFNAIPGVTLPATITKIAPTATPSQTVVNFAVTVEVDAAAAARIQSMGASSNSTSANVTSRFPPTSGNVTGGLPEALQRAVESGRITQQQAEAMAQQAASGNFSTSAGGGLPFFTGQASSQTSSAIPEHYQLMQGLTCTVNLIVAQRNNVLLVPNSAITKAGNQSTVQVLAADGTIEKRVVQTGLNDWQNTEITSGLSEGEKLLVAKGTTTTTTSTSSQQRPPGGIFFGR